MKFHQLTIFLLFTSILSFSQENIKSKNTLENQFDSIYRTSTTYQVYKVISKVKYQKLKLNVLDSLKSSKEIILEKETLLNTERNNIKTLKTTLTKTQEDLETALKKENSISFLGIRLSKALYNLIVWGLILVLLSSLLYFIFKFSKSNLITKSTKNNLEDVEHEFEQHRKKSLEREQKLRRQLQDEINKQRNS